jgi:bifunctional DNA-binding transcriptional regulator/antitoxin component of YhaV-PrlF toxin-antitoxin module
MKNMIATTKIDNKYQTIIPAEIIKRLNIDENYVIKWELKENNKVILSFIKNNP